MPSKLSCFGALLLLSPPNATAVEGDNPPTLRPFAQLNIEAAEVVAAWPDAPRFCVTSNRSVLFVTVTPSGLRIDRAIDVAAALERPGVVTHVAIDPRGRGVAATCFIPTQSPAELGIIAWISLDDGRLLGTSESGFHPDACAFSADGNWLVVACEGEPNLDDPRSSEDPPGSVSILDLREVTSSDEVGLITTTTLFTTGIDAAKPPLRIHPSRRQHPALDVEPEYVAIQNGHAWISLQENNGIAKIDLAAGRIDWIRGLGATERIIDGRSDGKIRIEDRVHALYMPDQIAVYEVAGHPYLVTADEGDDRGMTSDLADMCVVGGLHVCAFTGDVDGDGKIDDRHVLGARSLSIWDAETLEPVGSTGSEFERWTSIRAPELFNAAGKKKKLKIDARSTDRGPEPEGVVLLQDAGRVIAFCSLERPGAIAAVDVTDPATPTMLDFYPLASPACGSHRGPEGLTLLPPDKSPTGRTILLVGCETSGTVVALEWGSLP